MQVRKYRFDKGVTKMIQKDELKASEIAWMISLTVVITVSAFLGSAIGVALAEVVIHFIDAR